MNRDIMRSIGFEKELEKIDQGLCPFCGEKIGKFKDEISIREFKISGLCQKCQDETFK
jgi:hypothetical protein